MENINERISTRSSKRKVRSDVVLKCSFVIGLDGNFSSAQTVGAVTAFRGRYGIFRRTVRQRKRHFRRSPLRRNNTAFTLKSYSYRREQAKCKAVVHVGELTVIINVFHEIIGKKWGLQRGKIGSDAEHLDTAAVKLKKIKEEVVTVVIQQSKREKRQSKPTCTTSRRTCESVIGRLRESK